MTKVLVLNGPNLNRLGSREPEIYGVMTLDEIENGLDELAKEFEISLDCRQSNSESELIAWLHEAIDSKCHVILNPAAFTHYSYALRDAVAAVTSSGLKLVEVHISNPHGRELFRQNSVITAVATGVIAGFGQDSYQLALRYLVG